MEGHSGAYQVGSGPLERLRDRIGIEYSAETAAELAREPEFTATLTEPYLTAYSGAALRLLGEGDWRGALKTQRLAVNAVGAMPDASLEVRAQVVLSWLAVATGYTREVPDARVFRAAIKDGEALLAAARAAGDREIEVGALLGLGRLAIFPYPLDAPALLVSSRLKRWFERRDEELGAELEEIEEGSLRIEPMDDAIVRADGLLREAFAIAEGRQRGLVAHALLRCCDAWAVRGAARGEDEIVELAKTILAELGWVADIAMVAEAALQLALRGLVADDVRIAELLAVPPQEVWRATDRAMATAAALKVAEFRGLFDSDEGLRVIGDSRAVLDGAPELVRLDALRLEISLLLEVDLPFALDEVRGLEAALGKLAEVARHHSWTTERHARAVLLLALSSGSWSEELLGKRAVVELLQSEPDLFTDHLDAIGYGLAGLQADWAVRLAGDGDRLGSVEKLAMAAGQYLHIGAVDAALETLRMLTSAADHTDSELQWAVLVGISRYVLPREPELGEAGARALRKLWAQTVMHMLLAERAELNLFCAQLGKGRRFAAALAGRHRYAAREDAEGTELLEQIAALRRSLGDPRRDAWLDEITLMRPYSERLDALSTLRDADRLEGLQRTFDARVQAKLSGAGTGEEPPLLQPAELQACLGPETVLIALDQAMDTDGNAALASVIMTDDGVLSAGLDSTHDPTFSAVTTIDGRKRAMSALELSLILLRTEVAAEPGPRPVTREGAARLEAAATEEGGFFIAPVQALAALPAPGKRHVCVVPSGPLHFAPLHLVSPGGRPLALDWTITYLPSLSLLRRRAEPARREDPLTAIGLDFPPGNPLGMAPIDGEAEARAVSALFGTAPVLGEAAVERAVREALERSRFVHLATHGAHDVAAPAFQCLYVAEGDGDDGRIAAYELLDLDLRGLELVTLSACETALGRVDLSDNLRGLPASLLLRGAQTIIGTLWTVADEVSRIFFTDLYRQLRGGKGRLAAFAGAQAHARDRHPRLRDWGAFYYIGEWREG